MMEKYQQLVVDKARQYGVDPDLALRVVQQESGFNPNAVSRVGAGGLMQLMPGTAKDLGLSEQDRFDPEKNVDAGMRYLSKQIQDFGDVGLGLAAYNAGPGNVRKAGNQIPQFKETQEYVRKILGGGSQPQQVVSVQQTVPAVGQEVQQKVQDSYDDSKWEGSLAKMAAMQAEELQRIRDAREELRMPERVVEREEAMPMNVVVPQLRVGDISAFVKPMRGSKRMNFAL